VFWPEDFLPSDFKNARIATYGYDSKITHWFGGPANQNTIFDHGETLLNDLKRFRRSSNNTLERPIIFIVHSLGRLILKEISKPFDPTLTPAPPRLMLLLSGPLPI
jgi:ankyrin repeat domain-containing protein 50